MAQQQIQLSEIFKRIDEEKIQFIDLKFTDMPGMWQHFTVPATELKEGSFESGFGFDGSSIRGFQEIDESDMLIIPDPAAAFIDPFSSKTLSMIGSIRDPITKGPYSRDPRYVAQKAAQHLKDSGIADAAYFGPEAEFFIFDGIRFGQNENSSFHQIDSFEGIWDSRKKEPNGIGNLGHRPRFKEGYFPVPPVDKLQDIRNDIVREMTQAGIAIECHHHEVATAGQCEIDMRFGDMVKMADQLMLYKFMVKNVAARHGKAASFMPKPLFNDNGSGMHCHQSLWKDEKNIFVEKDGYAGLSGTALYYIGGLLHHAPALCALIAPTTNSYRRLVPGFEAPVNLVYSKRNRSAAVRIPMYSGDDNAKRIEFRTPDPSCNPYLAFAAMLMAGIDGIKRKIHPGEPVDENLYELPPERAATIASVPGSLKESLQALKDDHEFLLQGDVFTRDLIDMWISYKMAREVNPVSLRPTPYEFHLYHDV
ncbi:type I glutamate--ammonia ligase [Candidatus Woesearchaeota archaeon]|nr:type I glutamate--ammonia ligase [Candidatus Woesearchaeota archaeon]